MSHKEVCHVQWDRRKERMDPIKLVWFFLVYIYFHIGVTRYAVGPYIVFIFFFHCHCPPFIWHLLLLSADIFLLVNSHFSLKGNFPGLFPLCSFWYSVPRGSDSLENLTEQLHPRYPKLALKPLQLTLRLLWLTVRSLWLSYSCTWHSNPSIRLSKVSDELWLNPRFSDNLVWMKDT